MAGQDWTGARRAGAVMFAVNGFTMGVWAPQIPLLLPRHGIGEGVLGLLILLLGLGAVAAMLFSGRLIARFGSVAVLRLLALALVPVLPLVVFAPALWLLAPAMALMGAVVGCMDVAMNANAVEVERRLGRAIMSSCHGFWSLGGFLGGTAGSFAIAHGSAEIQALVASALVGAGVLIALPHLRGAPPHPPEPASAAGPRRGLLPRAAAVWMLGVMALASMVPEGAVLDWAALYMGRELGAGAFTAGLAFAGFSGAMAVMRFLGDGVRNRHGAAMVLRISAGAGAAGLMLAALAPLPELALAGFALAGLGIANLVPILFSAAGNMPDQPPGVAISAVTMLGYAGILIAPATIGFLAEHLGYRPTYAALALLLLAVAQQSARVAVADGPGQRPVAA